MLSYFSSSVIGLLIVSVFFLRGLFSRDDNPPGMSSSHKLVLVLDEFDSVSSLYEDDSLFRLDEDSAIDSRLSPDD
jgi:hypothetical protein